MKELYGKLLEIQKEIGAIKKTEENPFFKSKYFDINSLLAAVKPVLNSHGIILLQGLDHDTNNLILVTQLVDAESGESIQSSTILPLGTDPQKQGSVITYFRRYAIQSLLALEAEDDDGNTASEPSTAKSNQEYHPDGERVSIFVEDIYTGKTKPGDPYQSLKTESGKVMVWQDSGLLNTFVKGAQYDVDIKRGAVVAVYEEEA